MAANLQRGSTFNLSIAKTRDDLIRASVRTTKELPACQVMLNGQPLIYILFGSG